MGVHPELLAGSNEVKKGLIRGYCDADGSPVYNKSRKQPLIKIESVNFSGLLSINNVFQQLDYNSHLWRESKTRGSWGLYLTRLQDVERYYQEIGFKIQRKHSRLAKIIELKKS